MRHPQTGAVLSLMLTSLLIAQLLRAACRLSLPIDAYYMLETFFFPYPIVPAAHKLIASFPDLSDTHHPLPSHPK